MGKVISTPAFKDKVSGKEEEKKTENNHEVTYIDVPQFAAGFPIMMLSETPSIMSVLPYAEASNK